MTMSKLTLLALLIAPVFLGIFLLAEDGPASTPKSPASGEARSDATKQSSRSSVEKKYPDQDPAKGSLEGRVTIEGDAPSLPPKLVAPNHKDQAACANHLKEERWILSERKEVKDAVVSLRNYKPVEKVRPREISIDNLNCTFIPHVSATTVGSTLKVTNSDAFIHNFHANLALQANFALGPGQSETKKLPRDGWVAINCDFHTWMAAHIKVFAHDLFDVTGCDGSFRIQNIPPGRHEIEIWHEYPLLSTRHEVTIEAGTATKLDVALKVAPKN